MSRQGAAGSVATRCYVAAGRSVVVRDTASNCVIPVAATFPLTKRERCCIEDQL